MSDQQLMDYFKFDGVDLQANQNGQFTEKQRARMIKDAKSGGIWDNLGAYIFLLIALIGLAVAIPAVMAGIQSSNLVPNIALGLSFGCIWPLVWGGIGVRSLMYSNSFKHDFKLARVQGYANIESRQPYSSDSMVYTLHMGDKTFNVDKSLTEVLMPGAEYIVYYYIRDDLDALISTKNILSAELISKASRLRG